MGSSVLVFSPYLCDRYVAVTITREFGPYTDINSRVMAHELPLQDEYSASLQWTINGTP